MGRCGPPVLLTDRPTGRTSEAPATRCRPHRETEVSHVDKPARDPRQARARRPRGEVRRGVGAGGRLPLPGAPTAAARACTRSTPRRPRRAGRCTSGTSSPSRTPTCSRGSTACRATASSTRWAGTTTGCRPSAGCRTTTASRCDPSLPYDPAFTPPSEGHGEVDARRRPDPDLPPQLHRALRAPDRRGRAEVRGGVPRDRPLRRLAADLPDDRRRRPGDQPARLPRQPRPRRGVPGGGAEPLGRDVPHRRGAGRARGQGPAGRVPHGRLRRSGGPGGHRDHTARAAAGERGARGAPGTTSGTPTCSGRRSAPPCSAWRCPCSRTTSRSRTRAPASP